MNPSEETFGVAAMVWTLCLVVCPAAWSADSDRLIYHAETLTGDVVASRDPDTPFNPASVVKAGTSLWALDRLGRDFRYSTWVGYLGVWDRAAGTIHGALVVRGGGDPDFHLENAFLVARWLNALGVHRVAGDLAVTGTFAMGWENGVEGGRDDPPKRALKMGRRLLDAVDSSRWTASHRQAWAELCARRGWDPATQPGVAVTGTVRYLPDPGETQPLVLHRSNPLWVVLRRFNVHSNNDIVRIADGLGGAGDLTAFLRNRLAAEPLQLELRTASGQKSNRMTARIAVELMRGLRSGIRTLGLELDDILPVPGCDPGPTGRMFPDLAGDPNGPRAVVKTGTLTSTDGGVVVLAGAFDSLDRGTIVFCVAATDTGRDITRWRAVEQDWLLELMASLGGTVARSCGPELPFSDSAAILEFLSPQATD